MTGETTLEPHELLAFDLLAEDAGSRGCLGHIPALPGLCFRAETAAELERIALARIVEYARWLLAEDLADLTPDTEALVSRVRSGDTTGVHVVEMERLAGSPVWISGNPAVLFQHDRCPFNMVYKCPQFHVFPGICSASLVLFRTALPIITLFNGHYLQ